MQNDKALVQRPVDGLTIVPDDSLVKEDGIRIDRILDTPYFFIELLFEKNSFALTAKEEQALEDACGKMKEYLESLELKISTATVDTGTLKTEAYGFWIDDEIIRYTPDFELRGSGKDFLFAWGYGKRANEIYDAIKGQMAIKGACPSK
jgi:hypothetical protein